MPSAKLYEIDLNCDFNEIKTSGLTSEQWKVLLPVSERDEEPLSILAVSDESIAYLVNRAGKFTRKNNWNTGGQLPANLADLEFGRNATAGRFSEGSLIDLFVEAPAAGGAETSETVYNIWQVTPDGLVKLPLPLCCNFPWDRANPGQQLMTCGRFFAGSPADGLLFYQGNSNQDGTTGMCQIFEIGMFTAPLIRDARATWSSIIPYEPGPDSITHLFMFDDGSIVTNHRGKGFQRFPYSGPNPTAPFVELRRPKNGRLTWANLSPQPGAGSGPPVPATATGAPVTNRQVAGSGAPFLHSDRPEYVRRRRPGAFEPQKLDWWNGGYQRNVRSRFAFGNVPAPGFLHCFARHDDTRPDPCYYRVLDGGLRIVSGDQPKALPENPDRTHKLPDLIIPGKFMKNLDAHVLFYWL